MPDSNDAERITAMQAGDANAFEMLVEEYQKIVLAFIFRMIGDADEAQDVAQEVFVRAYRAIQTPRFNLQKASLSTWLLQIARNAAIDTLRKRKRKPFFSLENISGFHETIPDTQTSPDEQLATNELQERIAKALLRLPEDQRTALVLSVYHEHSHEQIAAILQCSTKSVESRIYRARKKLAQWLI